MINTYPYDLTPARTQDDMGAGIPATADPAVALHTLIQRRQALLHQESADLRSLRSCADKLARRHASEPPRDVLPADIVALSDAPAVAARLDAMVAAARTEVLILDGPSYDSDAPSSSGAAQVPWSRVRELLERGVAVRTVTDGRSIDFPNRLKALTELSGLGLLARTGQRLATSLVIVDRRTCLLPGSRREEPDGTSEAALVLGGILLHRASLRLFESIWARAPVGGPGSPLSTDQRELLGLLASGPKDESIARRLGVHVHTARRRITQMLEELDADTRFQAGVQAALRGWLHPAP